jgi:hypothetical protein
LRVKPDAVAVGRSLQFADTSSGRPSARPDSPAPPPSPDGSRNDGTVRDPPAPRTTFLPISCHRGPFSVCSLPMEPCRVRRLMTHHGPPPALRSP